MLTARTVTYSNVSAGRSMLGRKGGGVAAATWHDITKGPAVAGTSCTPPHWALRSPKLTPSQTSKPLSLLHMAGTCELATTTYWTSVSGARRMETHGESSYSVEHEVERRPSAHRSGVHGPKPVAVS